MPKETEESGPSPGIWPATPPAPPKFPQQNKITAPPHGPVYTPAPSPPPLPPVAPPDPGSPPNTGGLFPGGPSAPPTGGAPPVSPMTPPVGVPPPNSALSRFLPPNYQAQLGGAGFFEGPGTAPGGALDPQDWLKQLFTGGGGGGGLVR